MKYALLWLCALSAASPALAQKAANRDGDGHLFCNADGIDLRETGTGGYKVDIGVENLGAAESAVYPAGGAKLFGPQAELRAHISINYAFLLDANGNPVNRPHPVRLSAATGRFAGARLEPFESLELRVAGGVTVSDPIRANQAYYTIALIGGEVGLPGSSNPYDSEAAAETLGKWVSAIENGERWILLYQHGKEVARIPVPQRDMADQRNRSFAWVRAAVPLLTQGKCPA